MFDIEKDDVNGRRGWIVRHATSRQLVSGDAPFKTKRTAQKFVVRLPGVTIADGSRFDWVAPGVPERLAAGCGQDGGSLISALAALRAEVELEVIDEPKPRPKGLRSPFGSVTELRAHLRASAGKYVGHDDGKAWSLTLLASNKTLGIAPGGELIYWREGPSTWVIATSFTAAHVTWNGIADGREAHELASWLETQVTDGDGTLFPFGAADVGDRIARWRSARGVSLEDEVTLLRAAFDRSKGRTSTWETDLAERIEGSIARRKAIARRAAAGGYEIDRPCGLVRHDQIEFDVTVGARDQHRFVGDRAPTIGATVTLRGVVARPVSHTENGVGVAFERGGLRWRAADGGHGVVSGDAWRFDAYALQEALIYRYRDGEIDSLAPEIWDAAKPIALGISIGLSRRVMAALVRAEQRAAKNDCDRALFTREAREAGAALRRAPAAELDRTLMSLRGSLDEDWSADRVGLERSSLSNAALLLAVVAERQHRGISRVDEEYWSGPAFASRIRWENEFDPGSLEGLPPRILEGALDYAEARCDANAGWRAHLGTSQMAADGEAWRAAAAVLAAACEAARAAE